MRNFTRPGTRALIHAWSSIYQVLHLYVAMPGTRTTTGNRCDRSAGGWLMTATVLYTLHIAIHYER